MSTFRVAFVYPPFGPSGLPSLGLGLLAAGLRARGVPCEVIYWNLEVLAAMPFTSLLDREAAYRSLTTPRWHPFNEWIFAPLAYDDPSTLRDLTVESNLLNHALELGSDRVDAKVVLDFRARAADWVDAMVDRLAGFAVVGIASTFYQHLAALALARAIKKRFPSVHVVLGGANCDDDMGRATLELFPQVDFVFSGEVDRAMPEFASRIAAGTYVHDIPGLHWRGPDGKCRSGPAAAPIVDLDSLPLPEFDDFVKARDAAGLTAFNPLVLALESSRGCWWGAKSHCTFCGLNANGMAHRAKTPERFFAEVEAMRQRYDARYFFMADNILDMRYFDALVARAERDGAGVEFFYEIKSNAKRAHVERLAKAGVTAVQPGIEHLSSEVLRLMRKGVTGAQNVAFLKYAHDEGVLPVYNILMNFPGERVEWHLPTVAQMNRLSHLRPPSSVPQVEFHRFSPYYRSPAEFNIALEPLPEYATLYPFSRADVARLAYRFHDPRRRGLDSFGQLTGAVAEWHRAYAGGATLVWWREGHQVLIADTRPGFGPRTLRLAGGAVGVFELLDEPRSLPHLVDRLAAKDAPAVSDEEIVALHVTHPGDQIIAFDRGTFIDDPISTIELFDAAGLVFVDRQAGREPLYVTLPVAREHPPLATTWLRTGV